MYGLNARNGRSRGHSGAITDPARTGGPTAEPRSGRGRALGHLVYCPPFERAYRLWLGMANHAAPPLVMSKSQRHQLQGCGSVQCEPIQGRCRSKRRWQRGN
jgi:hypothetical protein